VFLKTSKGVIKKGISCIAISTDAFASVTPVRPPIVNKLMNPKVNNIGVLILRDPPQAVANQEKILIAVGTAIIIVALVK
jgi:hypothetical protein